MAISINHEEMLDKYETLIDEVEQLSECMDQLPARNQGFASDLVSTFANTGFLSVNQAGWVGKLLKRVKGSEPIYGDFKAIFVMFRMAAANGGLKFPKIRLMSKGGRFVLSGSSDKTTAFAQGQSINFITVS